MIKKVILKIKFIIRELKYIVNGRYYKYLPKFEIVSRRFAILNLLSGNRLAVAIHNIDMAACRASKMYCLQKHPELDYSLTKKKFLNRSPEELNRLEGERLHDLREAIDKAFKL